MNVEIGAEAAQFPEKEYINGIAFAVQYKPFRPTPRPSHQAKLGKTLVRTNPLGFGLCGWELTPSSKHHAGHMASQGADHLPRSSTCREDR
jgi:hypothetical protein